MNQTSVVRPNLFLDVIAFLGVIERRMAKFAATTSFTKRPGHFDYNWELTSAAARTQNDFWTGRLLS